MVRSCGIHIDRDFVRVVSLDGGAKKHKLAIQDEEPINGSIASALKTIAKRNKLKAEDIGLAVESSSASFRRMTLPFDDRDKIEEVIKFEVENDLPQWDIDDIIIDFLVTSSLPGVSSDLVVCAIPKQVLEPSIEQLSKSGLEPAEAELDASAVFDAVLAAGELVEDEGAILLHVGDGSTILSVADGERLFSMRALRVGATAAQVIADEPDDEAEADGDTETEPEGEASEAPVVATVMTASERSQRDAKVVTRLRRELMRTVTGSRTEHEITAVLLTGDHIEGLDQIELEGVDVRWVGALEGEIKPSSMVAYGAALHQLGGGVFKPRMRREELRYTGTLERLELPLAVFSMLLFAFLFTRFMIVRTHLNWRDEGNIAAEQPGDMQLWLEATLAYLLPKEGQWPGRVEKPSEALLDYAKLAEGGGDDERTKFEELSRVKRMLQGEILEIQKDLGQVSEITLPLSAFKGGVLVMDVMDALQKSEVVPRFGCRGLQADYISRKSQAGGDVVEVKLDVDFWGEDSLAATKHFNDFKTEMERQPWCESVEAKALKSVDGQPIAYVDGMKIIVDPTKVVAKGDA